jgi:hypothetical protein
MLSDSQIEVIVVGSTLGLEAMALVAYDAWIVANRNTPQAYAYAASAAIGVVSFLILLALLGVHGAPMPSFGIAFPIYLLLVNLGFFLPRFQKFVFVASAILYWVVSINANRAMLAAATPLLIVHHGVALFVKPKL